jgi:hypothetical protein
MGLHLLIRGREWFSVGLVIGEQNTPFPRTSLSMRLSQSQVRHGPMWTDGWDQNSDHSLLWQKDSGPGMSQ